MLYCDIKNEVWTLKLTSKSFESMFVFLLSHELAKLSDLWSSLGMHSFEIIPKFPPPKSSLSCCLNTAQSKWLLKALNTVKNTPSSIPTFLFASKDKITNLDSIMNLVLQNFVAGNKRNYLCILIKSFNLGENEFRVRNFDNKNINESVISSKPIKLIYIRCRHRFLFFLLDLWFCYFNYKRRWYSATSFTYKNGT